jgi:hypothetical protein
MGDNEMSESLIELLVNITLFLIVLKLGAAISVFTQ